MEQLRFLACLKKFATYFMVTLMALIFLLEYPNRGVI